MKKFIKTIAKKSNNSTKSFNEFQKSELKPRAQKQVKGGTTEFVIIEDTVDI